MVQTAALVLLHFWLPDGFAAPPPGPIEVRLRMLLLHDGMEVRDAKRLLRLDKADPLDLVLYTSFREVVYPVGSRHRLVLEFRLDEGRKRVVVQEARLTTRNGEVIARSACRPESLPDHPRQRRSLRVYQEPPAAPPEGRPGQPPEGARP
jgi:hypothetical protein